VIFRQFIDEDLGCASYLLGDGGEAVVIDPSWETAPYLGFAAAHGLRIARVLETHTHADHLSGRGRLAAESGAELSLPAGAVAAFVHRRLAGGELIAVGELRLEVLPTPGHRPEHIALVLTDTARADGPLAVLSGDSLLVGDVARPDLVGAERADSEEAARSLYGSIRRLAALPDHVELWPGHIGGSLCGGSGTSEKPSSTIGYERATNVGLAARGQERFVAELLARLPERPPTVERVVELNRGPLLERPAPLRPLAVDEVQSLLERGGAIVDGRSAEAFDEAAIPGSLCLPLDRPGVGTRAAWLLGRDQPLVALAASAEQAEELATRLAAVGLLALRGWLAGGVEAWRAHGGPLARIGRVDVARAVELVEDGAVLLDVRDAGEAAPRPLAGTLRIPWRELRSRAGELRSSGRAIVVGCASGRRTPIAASLLGASGGPALFRLVDGSVAEVEQGLLRRDARRRSLRKPPRPLTGASPTTTANPVTQDPATQNPATQPTSTR